MSSVRRGALALSLALSLALTLGQLAPALASAQMFGFGSGPTSSFVGTPALGAAAPYVTRIDSTLDLSDVARENRFTFVTRVTFVLPERAATPDLAPCGAEYDEPPTVRWDDAAVPIGAPTGAYPAQLDVPEHVRQPDGEEGPAFRRWLEPGGCALAIPSTPGTHVLELRQVGTTQEISSSAETLVDRQLALDLEAVAGAPSGAPHVLTLVLPEGVASAVDPAPGPDGTVSLSPVPPSHLVTVVLAEPRTALHVAWGVKYGALVLALAIAVGLAVRTSRRPPRRDRLGEAFLAFAVGGLVAIVALPGGELAWVLVMRAGTSRWAAWGWLDGIALGLLGLIVVPVVATSAGVAAALTRALGGGARPRS